MAKFEEVLAPGITIRESANDGSDFTNPTADYRRLFLGEDGLLHLKDSAGTVTDLGGGGGDITTDPAWAAKGNLIVGTGNDAASILSVGANDTIPMADSGEATGIKWVAAGTPSTQAFGDSAVVGTADTFTRGDHKHAMPAAPTVASDAIWDAAGDLAVGSGADTAARLAKGGAGGFLTMANGVVSWGVGTSFPGSPATNDLFHRTDLTPALWRFDGTRWLSVQRFRTETPVAAPSSGNATIGYISLWNSEFGCWLVDFRGITHVATTNNGTNYWTVNLKKWSDGSNIVTFNTTADTAATDAIKDNAIGAVTTENALYITVVKTLSPGNLYPLMVVTYNLIAT